MTCHVGPQGVLNALAIEMSDEEKLFSVDTIAAAIHQIAAKYSPSYAEVSPSEYFKKRVFDDKPGIGWMLYLPKVIAAQQVPEARALIPVPVAGKQQTGTIIVSITDAVFSAANPEHVETANRIETRLADQNLLPACSDL